MINIEHKLEVLAAVADKLNGSGVLWAVGGSMMLYLRGAQTEVHDIDIVADNDDIDVIRAVFSSIGIEREAPYNPNQYATKSFLNYIVDDVKFEIMAGMIIILNGGIKTDCSLLRENIDIVNLLGVNVPLESVSRWREYYSLIGRDAKVKLIDSFLNQEIAHQRDRRRPGWNGVSG